MNRKVLAGGTALVAPLLTCLALGLSNDPRVVASPLLGKPAPDFTLTDLEGRVVRLSELRGRPVVLNFWATWCQPCVVEHPTLAAAASRFGERAHFLGVIYHDEPRAVRAFLVRRPPWGPSLIDDGSRVAIAFGVYGAPETYFIDADGIVVDKVAGALAPGTLYARLEELMAS